MLTRSPWPLWCGAFCSVHFVTLTQFSEAQLSVCARSEHSSEEPNKAQTDIITTSDKWKDTVLFLKWIHNAWSHFGYLSHRYRSHYFCSANLKKIINGWQCAVYAAFVNYRVVSVLTPSTLSGLPWPTGLSAALMNWSGESTTISPFIMPQRRRAANPSSLFTPLCSSVIPSGNL